MLLLWLVVVEELSGEEVVSVLVDEASAMAAGEAGSSSSSFIQ